jgi:hypothetical protein
MSKRIHDSGKQNERSLSEEEKQEDIQLINNFFLVLLGIVLGYFASAAASAPNSLGITVLILAVEKEIAHFPILPNLHQLDVLARATGFLILLPVTVIIFPLMLTRYIRWLKTQTNISLVRELTELFFLLFWPIGALWAINPSVFASENAQIIQRFIGFWYVAINLLLFFYKTRSVRRGFFY